jgi:hypothetical protein
MTIVLPALAVAVATFCVWLTVRIVNRRERWAKWIAGVIAVLAVLYVASSGPMRCFGLCLDIARVQGKPGTTPSFSLIETKGWWPMIYAPLELASNHSWGEPLEWYWKNWSPQLDFIDYVVVSPDNPPSSD